jgi:signal transduction histidine kinase/HAMP domain-containing protein
MDGVMAVDDVVYAVISGPDGQPLISRSKGTLSDARSRRRLSEQPLYPDPGVGAQFTKTITSEPLLTYLTVPAGQSLAIRTDAVTSRFPSAAEQETLYDFAIPVIRPVEKDARPDTLGLGTKGARRASDVKLVGLIQVGLTESHLNHVLMETIRTSALLTLLIIACGIMGTILLMNRIISPLRSLASVARRVTGGDLTASVTAASDDEIGQLAWLFNNMTQSLKERDTAISANLATISKQVRQLTTLNQASTAISSTLDLDKLLTTVLQLLTDNLGFVHSIVVFYDADQGLARVARVAGVPDPVFQAASKLSFPIEESGLHGDVLLRGKPLLVTDLEAIAHRLPPRNLELIRRVGVRSFVAAPLRSTQRILGYVGATRGTQPSTQEDLDVLTTLASHVAVAIDNARAYLELEELTTGLEQHVQERTQELQSANERLKELDRLKSAFVSVVSHELRTPMTAIRGYVDNLLDGLAGPLTEKQTHYLHRVNVNADRLTHMISELLDLSRIEQGRVELSLSEVDLLDLAADVIDQFHRPASEKGITLEVRAGGTVPRLQADRDKLHQVLTNLIGNAMKFTPAGGNISIEIDMESPDVLHVTVADSGCGIPPDELPRIFEKFFRGSAVPPEVRGAGLGLAIVRTLIGLHGGRVWVDSVVQRGSRFSFSLPLQTPPASSS